MCLPQWDGSLCYPPTRAGQLAHIPCDLGQPPANLTVSCELEAAWSHEVDLAQCLLARTSKEKEVSELELLLKLYLTGGLEK